MRRGWRVAYLGPDTPLDTLDAAAASLTPRLVAVTSVDANRIARAADGLAELGRRDRLGLGGSGAHEDTAAQIGAAFLGGDPIAAADTVTAHLQPSPAGA